MSPTHEIITLSRGRKYRRLVEYRYDPKRRRTVPRVVENLGPVHPIYRRPAATPPFETYRGTLVQFGLLATHVMNRTLTAEVARDLVEGMGEAVPPGTLHALGIRLALGEKTPSLEFLLWRSPPSPSPDSAPPARRRSRSSTGAPGRTSSPSAGGSG